MPTFKAPRGTRDLLPAERSAMARLERIGTDLAQRYGYRPIETPMFEQSAVFERGIGAVTDVVEKELFRIVPRTEEGETWALRPEPTAGIVRAYIQHGMQTWPQPVKVTTTGPMFRYDRPQAGRYRQFWQFDVEAIGDPGPAIDAEIVELAVRFYREAGLPDVDVLLNSIGDATCRPAYVDRLVAYYRAHASALPELERARLDRNPLRLLDSKDPAMAEINASAPLITDHLCAACTEHFAAVRSTPSGSITGSSRDSFADSTTTRARRSRSTPAASPVSSRRSGVAGATTAWRSCSGAGRRPVSASALGSTARCWLSRKAVRVRPPSRIHSPSSWGPNPVQPQTGCASRPSSVQPDCLFARTSPAESWVDSWRRHRRMVPTSR
jgi:hypothetical protein